MYDARCLPETHFSQALPLGGLFTPAPTRFCTARSDRHWSQPFKTEGDIRVLQQQYSTMGVSHLIFDDEMKARGKDGTFDGCTFQTMAGAVCCAHLHGPAEFHENVVPSNWLRFSHYAYDTILAHRQRKIIRVRFMRAVWSRTDSKTHTPIPLQAVPALYAALTVPE